MHIGCGRFSITPVSFVDLNKSQVKVPQLLISQIQGLPNSPSEHFFLVDESGSLTSAPYTSKFKSDLSKELGIKLFYPSTSSKHKTLDESLESFSPNGQSAIKTYGIKTFNDDLDNAYLIYRNLQSGGLKKIKVPALSNGEMYPVFWHPNSKLFYFMVCVGVDNNRSLELWEYDLVDNRLLEIGDTNGHVFISPNGQWIVWETGSFLNPSGLKPPLHSGLICLYETGNKINYQLTQGSVISYFKEWK
jgi:hypothetical protein